LERSHLPRPRPPAWTSSSAPSTATPSSATRPPATAKYAATSTSSTASRPPPTDAPKTPAPTSPKRSPSVGRGPRPPPGCLPPPGRSPRALTKPRSPVHRACPPYSPVLQDLDTIGRLTQRTTWRASCRAPPELGARGQNWLRFAITICYVRKGLCRGGARPRPKACGRTQPPPYRRYVLSGSPRIGGRGAKRPRVRALGVGKRRSPKLERKSLNTRPAPRP
jgi:hypothetical protein